MDGSEAAAAAEVVHLPSLEPHLGVGVGAAEGFPQSRRLQPPPMGTVKEEEEEEEGVAEHHQTLLVEAAEAVVAQLIPSLHLETSVGPFRAPGGLPVGSKRAFFVREYDTGRDKRSDDGFVCEKTRRGG